MTKSFKVCHISSLHHPIDPRIFLKECRSIAKQRRFDVTLLTNSDEGIEQAEREKSLRVIAIRSHRSGISRFLFTIPKILVRALKLRATIYHFHDPELMLIAPFLRLSGAKVIYDVHEDNFTAILQKPYLPNLVKRPLAYFVRLLEKATSHFCTIIIAEKYYREHFPNSVEVLNYPIIDNERQSADFAHQELDDKYEWFVYAGTITPDRGSFTHINILRDSPRTGLLYIGYCPPEMFARIQAVLTEHKIDGDRFHVIGYNKYVPHTLLKAHLRNPKIRAGLALFPYTEHYARKELTKFFDYLAAGLPIVVSNFPIWTDFVEKHECGIAVDPNAPGDLTVVPILQNRSRITNSISWASEEIKLISLYDKLVASV